MKKAILMAAAITINAAYAGDIDRLPVYYVNPVESVFQAYGVSVYRKTAYRKAMKLNDERCFLVNGEIAAHDLIDEEEHQTEKGAVWVVRMKTICTIY